MVSSDSLEILETELKLRGFSPRTVQTYLFYNRKFIEFSKKNPNEATEEDIKKYLADKMSSGKISNSSISLMKAALKFFYDDLLKKDIVNIKTPKIANKLPVVLSRTEIRKMIESTKNEKHRLMLLLLYSSGLRLSECVNLKYGDIDFSDGVGWVRSGKGRKDRMFILSKKLIETLPNKNANSSDYVFRGWNGPMKPRAVQKLVERAAKRAGIEKPVHVHTLRHTFATHLLENGTDIRKIQKLLGHTNLQTTQIYTSVSTEELKKVKSPLDILEEREKMT